jgi:hypothetical protein
MIGSYSWAIRAGTQRKGGLPILLEISKITSGQPSHPTTIQAGCPEASMGQRSMILPLSWTWNSR